MRALCFTCVHRGDEPIECNGFTNHPHPCHTNANLPCKGHMNHLQLIKDGKPVSGDVIFFDYHKNHERASDENHPIIEELRKQWRENGDY